MYYALCSARAVMLSGLLISCLEGHCCMVWACGLPILLFMFGHSWAWAAHTLQPCRAAAAFPICQRRPGGMTPYVALACHAVYAHCTHVQPSRARAHVCSLFCFFSVECFCAGWPPARLVSAQCH